MITKNEEQLIISGIFGDGCLFKQTAKYHNYKGSSIHREYVEFKKSIFTSLSCSNINTTLNAGYKVGNIYSITSQAHPEISKIKNDSMENNLNKLEELGLAIWFYDDGSFHNKKHFYNLNSHALSYDLQNDVLIPLLKNKLDINATIAYDRKVDGRIFTYLRVNKISGNALNISDLLKKYPMKCFKYKYLSSEAIPKGSSSQEGSET
ncbi:hypothetical protein KC678_05495 [Candidatus Dojkabacteria bacterium]|uniref:Homing endonuclease LAGLIDADG domain-containing protein n=1 Tax=Candidatus Dojkabacteria bacterium TaxID=2099670 RepID=A0A955L2G9_9BACT|nr:hypothetical protein [Candidatus Dojkabacteria bacterium]